MYFLNFCFIKHIIYSHKTRLQLVDLIKRGHHSANGKWKKKSFLSPPRDQREKKKSKGKYMLLKTSLRTESGCCRRGNHDDVAPLMVGHNYGCPLPVT